VAVALRDNGHEGPVTLVGREELEPYQRPPLSKVVLTADDERPPLTTCDRERFASLDVDFVAGTTATAIDRSAGRVVLSDGRALPYDRVVLALGARPRPLPIAGGEHALLLRTYADSLALRAALRAGRRVGIVGAGFIGLEVAASAVKRGCLVTVLEVAPQVMGRAVPAAIASQVADRHRAEGVDLRCGVSINHIERVGGGTRIVLAEGEPVEVDVLIAGVGAVPETALAAEAGLELDNGIATDELLRTSDPAIYAAGDCCAFPHGVFGGLRLRLESWRNALDQGAHVAANKTKGDEPYLAVPWFWSDQYDMTLHVTGLPALTATSLVRPRPDGLGLMLFGLAADHRLVSACALATGKAMGRDIRVAELLIGRQAVVDPTQLADPELALKDLLNA
jgi:3-phenylpropionate/trans-cinnamate dioxygenase ferredoxin reductase subunit